MGGQCKETNTHASIRTVHTWTDINSQIKIQRRLFLFYDGCYRQGNSMGILNHWLLKVEDTTGVIPQPIFWFAAHHKYMFLDEQCLGRHCYWWGTTEAWKWRWWGCAALLHWLVCECWLGCGADHSGRSYRRGLGVWCLAESGFGAEVRRVWWGSGPAGPRCILLRIHLDTITQYPGPAGAGSPAQTHSGP